MAIIENRRNTRAFTFKDFTPLISNSNQPSTSKNKKQFTKQIDTSDKCSLDFHLDEDEENNQVNHLFSRISKGTLINEF